MSTPAFLLDVDEVMTYGGPVDAPTALGFPDTGPPVWAAPGSAADEDDGAAAMRLRGWAVDWSVPHAAGCGTVADRPGIPVAAG